MSTAKPLKTALLICSTRVPRLSPSVTAWISSILSTQSSSTHKLEVIDLLSFPLPLSPIGNTIPSHLPLPLGDDAYLPEKENEIVNKWSRTVRSFDAFIFVMPQYNWSVPGVLKVALDALFHEWKGKPCGIVSYGGRGGGKAAAALREIWKGLRAGECVGGVELSLRGNAMSRAQTEGVLDEGVREEWVGEGKEAEILEMWEKLEGALRGNEE